MLLLRVLFVCCLPSLLLAQGFNVFTQVFGLFTGILGTADFFKSAKPPTGSLRVSLKVPGGEDIGQSGQFPEISVRSNDGGQIGWFVNTDNCFTLLGKNDLKFVDIGISQEPDTVVLYHKGVYDVDSPIALSMIKITYSSGTFEDDSYDVLVTGDMLASCVGASYWTTNEYPACNLSYDIPIGKGDFINSKQCFWMGNTNQGVKQIWINTKEAHAALKAKNSFAFCKAIGVYKDENPTLINDLRQTC